MKYDGPITRHTLEVRFVYPHFRYINLDSTKLTSS